MTMDLGMTERLKPLHENLLLLTRLH